VKSPIRRQVLSCPDSTTLWFAARPSITGHPVCPNTSLNKRFLPRACPPAVVELSLRGFTSRIVLGIPSFSFWVGCSGLPGCQQDHSVVFQVVLCRRLRTSHITQWLFLSRAGILTTPLRDGIGWGVHYTGHILYSTDQSLRLPAWCKTHGCTSGGSFPPITLESQTRWLFPLCVGSNHAASMTESVGTSIIRVHIL
jgi:hypothetical protein